jgi:hypothetical protein
MQISDNIPDSVKVAVSVSPSLSYVFLGLPLETWTYVLSAVVSIMFIIEKLPVFIERVRQFYKWVRYGTSSE